MTSHSLHTALLRPAVLQILRAAGFNYSRPAVLDTVTDLAARYLLLLASSTAQSAFNTHNSYVPTIQDVRLALCEAGAFRPQLSVLEEQARGTEVVDGEEVPFEDLRGIEAFVAWAQGAANKEVRRIAGFDEVGEIAGVDLEDGDDYVTALKKRQSKTGEESRYQGSVLGKDADAQTVAIVGGPVSRISDWKKQAQAQTGRRIDGANTLQTEGSTPATSATSGISSAPLTPLDEGMEVD